MSSKALPVSIHETFPDLVTVGEKLHPESTVGRTTIEQYEQSLWLGGRLTPAVAESIEKAKRVRETSTTIVYVAGPLTGVSENMKARYGLASEMLADYPPIEEGKQAYFGYVPHLHGTDPVKHPNVTSNEVRDIDCLWAKVVADVHLNFLKPMAHGNAIELGWSESQLIPSTNLNPEGDKLSRLTLGMHNVSKLIEYDEYASGLATDEKVTLDAVAKLSEKRRSGLGEVKLAFDELHAWQQTFPGRDPREFHYMSFYNLANPTLRQHGVETAAGYSIDELMELFGKQQLLAYVRDPQHKHYGKVGHINFADDYRGVGIVTQDGYPCMFDPFATISSLKFWPVSREQRDATIPETKDWDTLQQDPLFYPADYFGRVYDE